MFGKSGGFTHTGFRWWEPVYDIRLTEIFVLMKNCWSFDLSLLLAVLGFSYGGRLIN